MMPTWCASFREELLAETTMPLKWIAERLQMGTHGHPRSFRRNRGNFDFLQWH